MEVGGAVRLRSPPRVDSYLLGPCGPPTPTTLKAGPWSGGSGGQVLPNSVLLVSETPSVSRPRVGWGGQGQPGAARLGEGGRIVYRNVQTSVEGAPAAGGRASPPRPGKEPPLRNGPCPQTETAVLSELTNPRPSGEWAPLLHTWGCSGRGAHPISEEAFGHSLPSWPHWLRDSDLSVAGPSWAKTVPNDANERGGSLPQRKPARPPPGPLAWALGREQEDPVPRHQTWEGTGLVPSGQKGVLSVPPRPVPSRGVGGRSGRQREGRATPHPGPSPLLPPVSILVAGPPTHHL